MLSLAEELLLLALDDEKGTIPGSAQQALAYGLPAAGLVDLLLAGRLVMGEKKRVTVAEATPTGDDILDEMLAQIERSKRAKGIGDWVKGFGNGGIKKLRERLENRLVESGVLRVEEGRFLRLFHWHHYPTVDGAPEAKAREKLRRVLLEGNDPDARTAILISLARTCDLLHPLFQKEEKKRADERAKEIGKGEFMGEAVAKALQEVEMATTAAMVAIMAASTTSSGSSG